MPAGTGSQTVWQLSLQEPDAVHAALTTAASSRLESRACFCSCRLPPEQAAALTGRCPARAAAVHHPTAEPSATAAAPYARAGLLGCQAAAGWLRETADQNPADEHEAGSPACLAAASRS